MLKHSILVSFHLAISMMSLSHGDSGKLDIAFINKGKCKERTICLQYEKIILVYQIS